MMSSAFNFFNYRKKVVLFLNVFILISSLASSQTKEALRYEIDAKRAGVSYTSKDALPRGREFKRIDSTYYVGWMLEGTFKYEHAADYVGYKVAAEQLEKALYLIDHDFRKELRTRATDVMDYLKILKYHRDWDYMSYVLMNCYSNMEEPNKVWNLLQKCKKADLQDEMYLDTYNYLAWTVHRNRFYTSSTYSFLKNSIDENETYANKLLDSCVAKIKRDAANNKTIFSINYEAEKMPSVWHYKSILFTYQLNIPSGAYYYEKLRSTLYFPKNNFATFCAIQGDFKDAETYYDLSKKEDAGDKRMKESYYYASILNAYKNEPKKGIEELKNLIKANGSTPGFGWYNIALARDLIYDGQTDIAKRYALRAEQFKEIHIGTTLGQSHYDFSISLMNLLIKNREIATVKFLNKNWWYSPSDLTKIVQLTVEKYGLQFLIINQFSSNPERDRVIYKLFSTESTVSFDEIEQLIEGFSTNFFLEKFKQEITKDKRYNITRYYRYMVAKLLIKKGNFEEAKGYLTSILIDINLDQKYEKLLIARTYEALRICNNELKENTTFNKDMSLLYACYPQLIPFSGLQMPMRLHSNESTEQQRKIISNLKQANINWTQTSGSNYADVYVHFMQKEKIPIIQLHVELNGQQHVAPLSFSYRESELSAKKIAFYIFNIGNDDENVNMLMSKESHE